MDVNQCTYSEIYVSETSQSTLNVNGSNINYLYTGVGYNISYDGIYLTRGAVYGNITYSQVFYLLVYDGVVGISNVSVGALGAGPFAKLFVYNITVSDLYQTYTFTHDGEVQEGNVTGYSEVGIYNVTGNDITNVHPLFLANLNGTLFVNSSSHISLIAYNNSVTELYNSSVYGIELYDTAVAYFNMSDLYFTPYSSCALYGSSKMYVNGTNIDVLTLYNQSYFEGFDVKFLGDTYYSITSTIDMYGSSKMMIENSTFSTYPPTVVSVTDNAMFLAKNVSISADTDTTVLYASGSAVGSWNASTFLMDPLGIVYTTMALYDQADVEFRDILLNVTATTLYPHAYIETYNSSRFTAVNFNFSKTTNVYTSFEAFDTSALILNNVTAAYLIGKDNSTFAVYDSQISDGVYIYSNYSIVTLRNMPLVYAFVYGTLNLYDVTNTTASKIEVFETGKLIADNLTVNTISITYEEPEYPYPVSVLSNTNVDLLTLSITTHKTGNITFTGTAFSATPASSLFEHVTLNNVVATKKDLCLNLIDNTRVNGSDAEIAYLYVGFTIDTASPVVEVSPASLTTELGVPNQVIDFTIYESHPDIYMVTQNGSVIMGGHYNNGSVITVDVNALGAGTWEVILTANDTSTNTASATSIVTVYPSEPPVFTAKPPRTYTMTSGSIGNVLNWTATDHTPSFYEIYVNGTLEVNSTWSSGTPINYTIDSFDVGTYNVTIVLHDEAGNTAADMVTVVVSTQGPLPGFGGLGLAGIPLEYLIGGGIIGIILIALAVLLMKKRKGKEKTSKPKSKRPTKKSGKKRKK